MTFASRAESAARGPGRRAGLSTADVIAAARALLAQGGVASVSMRAIADHLGVAPNALYSHVADKGALLDAVLDDLIGEIPEPDAGLPPREALTAVMMDSYDALVRHPDLVAVSLARHGSGGRNAWRLGDRMLALFADSGVDPAAAREALRVLLVHLMGCAAFATQADLTPGSAAAVAHAGVRDDYRRGLGWLLDGILGATERG